MTLNRSAIIAVALAGLVAPSATAQSDTPSGRWAFETDPVTPDCILKGEMQIWPTNADGQYACSFIANQVCTSSPPLDIHVQQSCTAQLTGAQVNIESRVVRTVSVSPEDQRDRVDALYAPDNFFVSLSEGGEEMTGMFHSVSRAFVRFIRLEDLTS